MSTDGPAALEFKRAAMPPKRVWPVLLRWLRKPSRKVAFCPRTAGAEARRRETAAKRRIVKVVGA